MDLSFDIKGNLKPYKKVGLSYDEFVDFFVNSFEKDSVRHELLQNYQRYTQAFQEEVTTDFKQWINGSFVTKKKNPKDIDLVTLIDHQVFEEKESEIKREFIKISKSEYYGIDAYIAILYPENHNLHSWSAADLAYWNDWFTKSKMDKLRKRYPKGYIEISFNIQKL